jgi:hypothetical protein
LNRAPRKPAPDFFTLKKTTIAPTENINVPDPEGDLDYTANLAEEKPCGLRSATASASVRKLPR